MNKILLLCGIWVVLWFILLFIQIIPMPTKDIKKYNKQIMVVAIIIATAITFIIGGIILEGTIKNDK